jgi:hypothetical protein
MGSKPPSAADMIFEGDDLTRQGDEGPCESDRIFFRQHPKRRFRLRPAWTCEIEAFARHGGRLEEPPAGLMWWISVRQIAEGVRARLLLGAPHHLPVETSEADARRIWRRLRGGTV